MVKKCVRRCLTSLIIQKGFHSAQPSLRQNRVGNAAALPILSCHPCLYVPHGDGLNKFCFKQRIVGRQKIYGNGLQDKKFATEWGTFIALGSQYAKGTRQKKEGRSCCCHGSINSIYFAFRKDSAFEDNRKQETRMSVMEPLSLFWAVLPVLVTCISSSNFALALRLYVSQLNLS